MLIQFSVKNFMSFKEKAVLALNPSTDSEHPENINEKNGYKASNLIAIYGANASGKSNVIKGIKACVNMIRSSHTYNENTIFQIAPFRFDGYDNSQVLSMFGSYLMK